MAIDENDEASGETPMMQTVRRALLALLVVFMLGTGLDLMLLDHHEDAWQLPACWSRYGRFAAGPAPSRRCAS
jgi:hypothetical protein